MYQLGVSCTTAPKEICFLMMPLIFCSNTNRSSCKRTEGLIFDQGQTRPEKNQHREVKPLPDFRLIKGEKEECNMNASKLSVKSVQIHPAGRQKREVTRTSQIWPVWWVLHSWWTLPDICHCPHVNSAQFHCNRCRNKHAPCFQQELGKQHELYRVVNKPLSGQNRAPPASVLSSVKQLE